jgi:hypothetical protein
MAALSKWRLGVLAAGLLTAPAVASDAPVTQRLTIASDSSCPSETAIGEALAGLRPAAEWPSGAVRVHAAADALVVDLGTDSQRRLTVVPECTVRAATVALVIATWMDDLPAEAAATPVLHPTANETPAKAAQPPTVPPDATRAPGSSEQEIGAGLLLAVAGGIAPGVRVDFLQSRNPRGLGWQASLTLPAQHKLTTAGGSTRWTRAAASIALNGRVTVGRYAVSADSGLAGAYTFTSGQGYSIDQSAQSLTCGFVAGVRVGLPWRHVRLWTDLHIYKWLYPQSIQVDSAAGDRMATTLLPSWDGQWTLGLSYLFR